MGPREEEKHVSPLPVVEPRICMELSYETFSLCRICSGLDFKIGLEGICLGFFIFSFNK